MARRKKEESEDKAVKPSEVSPQIGKKKLTDLLRNARNTSANIGELNGSLREEIAQAVEHNHLHKKAFSTLRAMDKMTPEKLADYWDTLQLYMDLSGLADKAKSAPRLSLDESDEDEAPQKKNNVADFPRQTSVAAE